MEIVKLYERDLRRLIKEIEQYENEDDLWVIENEIKNSAGNLALHLCGNLQHFIGATLGNTDYVRQRENEFSDINVPASEIKARIETTIQVVIETLKQVPAEKLDASYPHDIFGHEMTTRYFVNHLYGHLNYHLGQINYHRRILSHGN